MIPANELRLGNLIYDVTTDATAPYTPCKVTVIHKDGVKYAPMDSHHDGDDACYNVPYEEIEGIPLTEEWLIRLGLRLESTSKWKSGFNNIARTDKVYTNDIFNVDETIGKINIDVIYNESQTELRRIGLQGITCGKIDGVSDIKYVHTLQNLYFALTGQELQLTRESSK